MHDKDRTLVISDATQLHSPATRRGFLRAMGLGGAVVLLPSVFAACRESTAPNADDQITADYIRGQTVTLDLTTDVGIFNYAYALEQLEAAFYTQVTTASNFSTLFTSADEREALTDITNDEVTHRQFLARALGSAAIPALSVNFGSSLASRDSVLNLAVTFEDVGVAAYNGAGKYLRNANNLLVAGKIVSVEARHAAALRDIRAGGTGTAFADLSQLTALGADVASARDVALEPSQVLPLAAPYVTTPVAIGRQPT